MLNAGQAARSAGPDSPGRATGDGSAGLFFDPVAEAGLVIASVRTAHLMNAVVTAHERGDVRLDPDAQRQAARVELGLDAIARTARADQGFRKVLAGRVASQAVTLVGGMETTTPAIDRAWQAARSAARINDDITLTPGRTLRGAFETRALDDTGVPEVSLDVSRSIAAHTHAVLADVGVHNVNRETSLHDVLRDMAPDPDKNAREAAGQVDAGLGRLAAVINRSGTRAALAHGVRRPDDLRADLAFARAWVAKQPVRDVPVQQRDPAARRRRDAEPEL